MNAGDGLTDDERGALVEALRFDRCEYGCAITYTTEAVKYDLAPAVERIVAARVDAARAEERERVERAEAEAHNLAADLDRCEERLWRLATLAGHVPDESDNNATAEHVVTEVLTDAQRALGVLRRERDALAATVADVRRYLDDYANGTRGLVPTLAMVEDALSALDAPAPEQPDSGAA